MTLYVPIHRSQYGTGNSLVTRHSGCTWTSGANGIDAITGGRKRPTPDQIHALVSNAEESNPASPGWSMRDLVLAMSRYGVSLVNRSGHGWAAVLDALFTDHYVVLQGDSDQFGNATCSGTFDGDHAIGVHPNHMLKDGVRWWWINDPICPAGRWERESVLQRYAVKLNASVLFGYFLTPVPEVVKPWRAVVHPKIGWFLAYTVTAGKITAMRRVSTDGFSAPCTAPKRYPFTKGGSRALVRLTAGAYKGLYIGSIWAAEVEA